MSSLVILKSDYTKVETYGGVFSEFDWSENDAIDFILSKIDFGNKDYQRIAFDTDVDIMRYKDVSYVGGDSLSGTGSCMYMRSARFWRGGEIYIRICDTYIEVSSFDMALNATIIDFGDGFVNTSRVKEVQGSGTVGAYLDAGNPKITWYHLKWYAGDNQVKQINYQGVLTPAVMRNVLMQFFLGVPTTNQLLRYSSANNFAFFKTGRSVRFLRRFKLPFVEV